MKRFKQKYKVTHFHPHKLRHAYASLQIADGVPLVVVSHNLGHTKPSTTNNIYAHVIAAAEAKSATIMDRFADVAATGGAKLTPKQPPDSASCKAKVL